MPNANPRNVRPIAVSLYFITIKTRMPLKFGPETTTEVTCARVRLRVVDETGREAEGWGETPLSVQWVWPSALSYDSRHEVLKGFCVDLVDDWASYDVSGHPIEVGSAFIESALVQRLERTNKMRGPEEEPMPWLAALVCASAFDIALHDAYGNLHGLPTYETYAPPFLNHDLAHFLTPAEGAGVSFEGRFPSDYLATAPRLIPVWHLVGGKDPVHASELTGSEPKDDHPVLLRDWVRKDGLNCLKVKLRGDDADWDLARLMDVGLIAQEEGVDWLSTDFNCTVNDPAYVTAILDDLLANHADIFKRILYVEQPFPYDLETHRIDVHGVAARKPLFMDESAHDWHLIKLGRSLGWSGVALKMCKTQTGALLSLCWAKAHGMPLMVQDLTNPMLAQIPHVLLAAHADTIMGVESNGMQFYPDASQPESVVHPGLYRRRDGKLDLSSIRGPGFGYRLDEIRRTLPAVAAESGKP